MTVASDGDQPERTVWAPRGIFTVAFLGITAGVQMSDTGLQAVSLSAIQETFEVSDATVGALQGFAGVLAGSALAVPLARYSDRYSRKRFLLCLILASTAMMVLSAIAPNFPLFFIGRSAAGITEFAMVPLVYSLIPDLAPERHRVASNLSFAALMAAGASGGFYFSGTILATATELIPFDIEPWRKGFLLLSAAGIPLLLVGMLTQDPPRRGRESATSSLATLWPFLKQRWQPFALFVGVAGCLTIAVQALNLLIALALEREFNALPGHIGEALGVIVLATAVGCLPVAGLLDRSMRPWWGRAVRPFIMGAAAIIGIPVITLLRFAPSVEQAFVIVGVFLFMTSTANALVPTMLQDLAPAELRARCFAVWSFVVSVFSATGPFVAGFLSDHVFEGHLIEAITVTAIPALVISALCGLRGYALARKS